MQKTAKEITEKEALSRLESLCSRSEHCSFEILEKMRRWGLDDGACNRVVAALKKGRYINDERYARAFANDKAKYDRWGRRKIDMTLRLKGIDESIRNCALDSVAPEDYANALHPLLKAKLKTTKAASDYELNSKLIRYAMGRGFDLEEIRDCLSGLLREQDE